MKISDNTKHNLFELRIAMFDSCHKAHIPLQFRSILSYRFLIQRYFPFNAIKVWGILKVEAAQNRIFALF